MKSHLVWGWQEVADLKVCWGVAIQGEHLYPSVMSYNIPVEFRTNSNGHKRKLPSILTLLICYGAVQLSCHASTVHSVYLSLSPGVGSRESTVMPVWTCVPRQCSLDKAVTAVTSPGRMQTMESRHGYSIVLAAVESKSAPSSVKSTTTQTANKSGTFFFKKKWTYLHLYQLKIYFSHARLSVWYILAIKLKLKCFAAKSRSSDEVFHIIGIVIQI